MEKLNHDADTNQRNAWFDFRYDRDVVFPKKFILGHRFVGQATDPIPAGERR
jgi:hypothetical protein